MRVPFLCLFVLLLSDAAFAFSPVAISLAPRVEVPTRDVPIAGLRLNLFMGKHAHVGGLDVGLFNLTSDTFVGLGVAAVLNKAKTAVGVQVGLINRASQVYGLQLGIVNSADHLHGVQIGLLNFNKAFIPFFPGINIGF